MDSCQERQDPVWNARINEDKQRYSMENTVEERAKKARVNVDDARKEYHITLGAKYCEQQCLVFLELELL